MAEDQGKQDKEEEKFDFTRAGEAVGYISLEQAGILAIRTASETPGEYGSSYQGTPMAFGVSAEQDTEDYYRVTLSFRPQGEFSGTPGQEQFFIEKEGIVAHRQVVALPKVSRRFPMIPVIIGLAVVVTAVILAIMLLPLGEGPGPEELNAAEGATSTPVQTLSDPSATSIPPAVIPGVSPTDEVITNLPGDSNTAHGLTGRYVNANDSSESLEINPDGSFFWVLPGEGLDLRGVWRDDGVAITFAARVSLRTKRIEGRELFDPDDGSWEKYGDKGGVVGTYMRLNFEQLGDYLDLLPDGSFIEEKAGVTSKGTWQNELGEVVLSMDSDVEIETTVVDGAIIDADEVRWVKQ